MRSRSGCSNSFKPECFQARAPSIKCAVVLAVWPASVHSPPSSPNPPPPPTAGSTALEPLITTTTIFYALPILLTYLSFSLIKPRSKSLFATTFFIFILFYFMFGGASLILYSHTLFCSNLLTEHEWVRDKVSPRCIRQDSCRRHQIPL